MPTSVTTWKQRKTKSFFVRFFFFFEDNWKEQSLLFCFGSALYFLTQFFFLCLGVKVVLCST